MDVGRWQVASADYIYSYLIAVGFRRADNHTILSFFYGFFLCLVYFTIVVYENFNFQPRLH